MNRRRTPPRYEALRIARRTMLYDWSQDWGAAADWSQGLVGMPLSAPHYTGRAQGDRSATFFTTR